MASRHELHQSIVRMQLTIRRGTRVLTTLEVCIYVRPCRQISKYILRLYTVTHLPAQVLDEDGCVARGRQAGQLTGSSQNLVIERDHRRQSRHSDWMFFAFDF